MSTLHDFPWEPRHHQILGSFTNASPTVCFPGLKYSILLYPSTEKNLRSYEKALKMTAIFYLLINQLQVKIVFEML